MITNMVNIMNNTNIYGITRKAATFSGVILPSLRGFWATQKTGGVCNVYNMRYLN